MKLRLILAAPACLIAVATMLTACASPDPDFDRAYPGGPYDLNQRVTALEESGTGTAPKQVQDLQEENAAIRAELAALTTSRALPNNDICGRSTNIQKILIEKLGLPSCQIINDRELLRFSELTVSSDRLWPGDLEGLHNVETLKLYLGEPPPENLLQNLDKLQDLTLQFKTEGSCGRIQLHGQHRDILRTGEHCNLNLGYQELRTSANLDCDTVLRQQLVFQRAASNASRINQVISRIQAQNNDTCSANHWNPQADDANFVSNQVDYAGATVARPATLATDDGTGCWLYNAVGYTSEGSPVESPDDAVGRDATVGSTMVPANLRNSNDQDSMVRDTSGRDDQNNIIIYWAGDSAKRPADNARCWLYVRNLRTWDETY